MAKQINIYRNDYSDYDSGHWDGVQSEFTFIEQKHSVDTRHGCVAQSRGDSELHAVLNAPDNARLCKDQYGETHVRIGDEWYDMDEVMAGCVAYKHGSQYSYRKVAKNNEAN